MSKTMRFCMVTTFYPPYSFGGDAMYIYRLSNELAQRGHEVEVVHCVDAYRTLSPGEPPSPDSYPNHPNVTVHSLKSGAGVLSPLITQQTGRPGLKAPKLRQIIDDGRFDVINFHNVSLIGAGVLSYGSGIKLYTLHEHWLVCPMHVLWKFGNKPCDGKRCFACTVHGKRPPQMWRYTGYMDRMLRHIDAFVAVSQFTRDKHREMGLSTETPIEHIPYFVPDAAPEKQNGQRDAPHSRPYFLFVGRLEKMKGAQVLIEAFRRYQHADLLIVGDGSYEAELRRQAQGLAHVRFLGRLPYQRIQALFREAIALLVPSIGYETFGIVILEAFIQGTPAIVNNLGALPEVVEQSCGGLVYSDVDGLIGALEALRLDPGYRRRLGENGRAAYLARWTPEVHLRQYFDLIGRIAAEKHPELEALTRAS